MSLSAVVWFDQFQRTTKKEFTKKLDFFCGLKFWVWKIVHQKIEILDICQGLMKMVECMEDEGLTHHKGETKNELT